MTWSLVARDASGAFGVAGRDVSTQALMNPLYARDGLRALDEGLDAGQALARLLTGDTGRDVRQVHIIDASGRTAAHTGARCVDGCGSLAGPGFSAAGNMLAGPQVLEAPARAYDAGTELAFAERLMAAMEAGEAAGGDKRGRQGAALRVGCRTTNGDAQGAIDRTVIESRIERFNAERR